ncbi:DUF4393 domain-containing protein [Bradyrhizobium sp. CSA112]|uniref:DUF4393 domain-containing protein n=1 Tax=Bradyrhizobium sp. CSA112 TaxID=2699170 RepID=UPI0023B0BE69|nr:DUF4393 domain-containing protein [Bradyrhizobium sp. CSA112]MDE5457641.1 DUF4393 domain-containing protein [Bradyrhizobium sp. CSA112]
MSPPARPTGQILEDLVKTIQLALAPIQLLGALQDRLRHFIDRSIRAVPEEHRVSPPPQILGPIIEAIRYEPEGTDLDKMFSALLSTSMDQTRVAEAHPAFAAIVRSLTPDEAKILRALQTTPISQVNRQSFDHERVVYGPSVVESRLMPSDLAFEGSVPLYLEHLQQLGLLHYSTNQSSEPIQEGDVQVGIRYFSEINLARCRPMFMMARSRP